MAFACLTKSGLARDKSNCFLYKKMRRKKQAGRPDEKQCRVQAGL
jgi:hypothetical protein